MGLPIKVEGCLLDKLVGGLREIKRHLFHLGGGFGGRGELRDWHPSGWLRGLGFRGGSLLDPRPHHAFKRPVGLCHASSLLSAVSPRATSLASPQRPSLAG